jgi:hypothetical protein
MDVAEAFWRAWEGDTAQRMLKAHPGVLAIIDPSLGETPPGGLFVIGGLPSGGIVIGRIG